MAKSRVLGGGDICLILTRHGFIQVRQRGSHIVMQRVDDAGTTTVIVPNRERNAGIYHSAKRFGANRFRNAIAHEA